MPGRFSDDPNGCYFDRTGADQLDGKNAYVHSSSSDPIDLLITDQPDCVHLQSGTMESDWIPTRFLYFDGQYSSDTADGHKGIGIRTVYLPDDHSCSRRRDPRCQSG